MDTTHDFNRSLIVGQDGEYWFLAQNPGATKLSGYDADFVLPNGDTVELKTTKYSSTDKDSYFFERYSNYQAKTLGGPWQAQQKGTSRFVYLYMGNKDVFVFETNQLVQRLEQWVDQGILSEWNLVKIANKDWVSAGWIVHREQLMDIQLPGVSSPSPNMVIAVSGKIGSGKDEFARMFTAMLPQYQIKSFAHKVKQVVSILTGLPVEFIDSREGKDHWLVGYNLNVRGLLQKVATDALRDKVSPDVWVHALFADLSPTSKWVIKDLRFPNEVSRVKQQGGLLVRINGNPTKLAQSNHVSETALDQYTEWDFVIDNNKDLEYLRQQVAAFILKFKTKL